MLRRLGVALLSIVCGCGRIGFDATARGDGGPDGDGDGGLPMSLLLPPGGAYDHLAIAPDGAWYASSELAGVWRSDDHLTWTRCAPGLAQDLAVADDGTVYLAGGGDGVRVSTDRCQSWTVETVDRYVSAIGTRGSIIYALVDNGLRQRSMTGWNLVVTGADGAWHQSAASRGSAIVMGTYGSGVLVSSGPGLAQVTSGFATPSIGAVAMGANRAFAITQASPTSNGGISCSVTGNLTSWSVCFAAGGEAIAVDPNDDQHLVFVPYDTLGQTENGFGSFDLDKQGFEMDQGNVDDVAFTATSGVVAATRSGVYYAPDRTLRWEARRTGLSAWSINRITVAGDDVYLNTQGGVMRSTGRAPFTLSTAGMQYSTRGDDLAIAPDVF